MKSKIFPQLYIHQICKQVRPIHHNILFNNKQKVTKDPKAQMLELRRITLKSLEWDNKQPSKVHLILVSKW